MVDHVTLRTSFACVVDAIDSKIQKQTVDLWIQSLRCSFYDSSHSRTKAKSNGVPLQNKFQTLESELITLFQQLYDLHEPMRGLFWSFNVSLVLALTHEPTAIVEIKKKLRQPNAPLAYLVISALYKFIHQPMNEQARHLCIKQGQEHLELLHFCHQALETLSSMDLKLLVEILELFRIEISDKALIYKTAQYLLQYKNHSSLLKLVQTYSNLEWDYILIIRTMIHSKDWGSAELVVKTFNSHVSIDLANVMIEEAIELQEFKRAHRLVCNFGLQHEFPDIEMLYNRDALLKLVESQRWTLALSFVGSDQTLQKLLLNHMIAAGELQHAMFLARERLGMHDFEPDTSMTMSNSMGLASQLPVDGYLELSIDISYIQFCTTEKQLHEAALILFNEMETIVGLDVEWKPTSTKIAVTTGTSCTTAVASILQIATCSHVFIIDLLELHNCDYLFDIFLVKLWASSCIIKVGFGFDSDLKVLHQTFPERQVFLSIMNSFVELNLLIQPSMGHFNSNSLSNVVQHILGQPLDKRMQLSNWEDRPLSSLQLEYAALDAFCLVQITQHIRVHGLYDDHGVMKTTWNDVLVASNLGGNGISSSSLIVGEVAVTAAVHARQMYQQAWKQHHHSGSNTTLLTMDDVLAFWEERCSLGINAKQEGKAELLKTPRVITMQDLPAFLVDVEPKICTQSSYLVINSICFFADERPCVACIDASSKLDTSCLASLCGVSRRKIKLASAMECQAIWGFSPGTIPPFGHHSQGTDDERPGIYIDLTLHQYEWWISGSGDYDHYLVLPSSTFLNVIQVSTISKIAISRKGQSYPSTPSDTPLTICSHDMKTQQEYMFLVDTMVARVGRWLRTIGINVIVWDEEAASAYQTTVERKNAMLNLAMKEHRIIITRDKKLADRRDAGACFVVSSDDPHVQFQEIKAHFALKLKKEEMMTRCARCNTKGFEIVNREYVLQQTDDIVHTKVLEIITEYWKCIGCHKLYWEGPKYNSAYENMLHMFSNADEGNDNVDQGVERPSNAVVTK